MASAKLANSTVNHSQTVIPKIKPGDSSPATNSDRTYKPLVKMLPT
jgi:hypothetical protein